MPLVSAGELALPQEGQFGPHQDLRLWHDQVPRPEERGHALRHRCVRILAAGKAEVELVLTSNSQLRAVDHTSDVRGAGGRAEQGRGPRHPRGLQQEGRHLVAGRYPLHPVRFACSSRCVRTHQTGGLNNILPDIGASGTLQAERSAAVLRRHAARRAAAHQGRRLRLPGD